MRLRGGFNIRLQGRPDRAVEVLPEPSVLYLPLWSRRFRFSELAVREGQRVGPGQALAHDPDQYRVPLLAPRAGTVRLGAVKEHVVLEDVEKALEEPYRPGEDPPHVPRGLGSAGMNRYKLLTLGAWQFFRDAHSGGLPDPFAVPQAVIISTLRLEPFAARGDVQLRKRLTAFMRGLEHLQGLLEYQPIILVLPDADSKLARTVREHLRGYAWVKVVEVPLRYPFDDFALLARSLGFACKAGAPVWALRTGGVLAVDRALTYSKPCTVRILSLGGSGVVSPRHFKAMPGYPLKDLLGARLSAGPVRVLDGGILTGEPVRPGQMGLEVECDGLTVIPEHAEREFLEFMRPGFGRQSYSRCFLGLLRGGGFSEQLTTALGGEPRPCISCGSCEEVCPAGIMPHMIHKYLYQDALEDADRLRVDLCVGCGLCSYVCPSKIDLRKQLLEAQVLVKRELHSEEAPA